MKTKILAIVLFMAVSIGVNAADTGESKETARAIELIERVQEIRTMDRGELTIDERKELKGELRMIKNELKSLESTEGLDDKVSISIGAIIIIILLIIII
ncbi:MAG: hypothetical protein RIF46_04620 [Cyclobacteriaceae bacterium]